MAAFISQLTQKYCDFLFSQKNVIKFVIFFLHFAKLFGIMFSSINLGGVQLDGDDTR
jgi:hypothetical protein